MITKEQIFEGTELIKQMDVIDRLINHINEKNWLLQFGFSGLNPSEHATDQEELVNAIQAALEKYFTNKKQELQSKFDAL